MNTSQLVLEKVPPKYPDASLRAGTEGAVVLEVGIDALGVVQDVTVISGDPILAKAATDAVAQWKYKPYLLDGSAIDIETQVTVNFHIANRTPPLRSARFKTTRTTTNISTFTIPFLMIGCARRDSCVSGFLRRVIHPALTCC